MAAEKQYGITGLKTPDHPPAGKDADVPTSVRAQKKVPVSRKEEDLFLADLERHGVISWSARAVGRSRAAFEHRRKVDPEFAQRYQEALDHADAVIEKAAIDRAVKGVPRLKVSGGQVVYDPRTGEPLVENEFSDLLLLNVLRAKNIRYAHHQRISVEHSGARDAASISFDDLEHLSSSERHQLLNLLAKIESGKRGETVEGGELQVVEDAEFAALEGPNDCANSGEGDGLSDSELAELAELNGEC